MIPDVVARSVSGSDRRYGRSRMSSGLATRGRFAQITFKLLNLTTSFRLCGHPEISNLRVQRALEGRPRGAAFDIGCEALVACDDVGVLQDSQHRRHHQIACRETVAIEIRLVAERIGEGGQAFLHKFYRPWAAQLRPFLIRVKESDQGYVHNERLDGVECRDQPLRRPAARPHLAWQQRLAPFADIEDDGPGFEEHETMFLECWHLTERLQRAICRFVLITLFKEACLIR